MDGHVYLPEYELLTRSKALLLAEEEAIEGSLRPLA
jgi:hypothetical protein